MSRLALVALVAIAAACTGEKTGPERGAELWGLARHLGLSPDEADDAVQETLLRLWAALRDGQAIERPDAWAFRTLYRSAMDRHRWRRRGRLLSERIGRQPVAQPADLRHRLRRIDRLCGLAKQGARRR